MASLYVVEMLPEVTRAALDILTRHPLRAGDAVQLASCLHLREHAGDDVALVAFDARLIEAARAEHLTIHSHSVR